MEAFKVGEIYGRGQHELALKPFFSIISLNDSFSSAEIKIVKFEN